VRKADGDRVFDNHSCYLDVVPEAVQKALDSTSCAVFLHLSGLRNALNTYVIWKESRPRQVFLFRVIRKTNIEVLNPLHDVENEDIVKFCEYVFSNFDFVGVICFRAVQSNLDNASLAYPVQRHNSSETYLISLPGSVEEYEANLGKSLRRNLRYYKGKLMRSFPSVRFCTYLNEEVTEDHIRGILRLTEARFQQKKVYYHESESSIARLIALSKNCGMVNIVFINGEICAGSINFRCGDTFIGHLLAHDSRYKEYTLGTLSTYTSICRAIELGGKIFDIGSSRFNYKTHFLGQRLDLDRIDIYRSKRHLALNAGHAARSFAASYLRRLKIWLHTGHGGPFKQGLLSATYMVKRIKAPAK